MTPVPCSAHHGISRAAASRRISEKGGWSESTCRIASQRASNATSKFETPAARRSEEHTSELQSQSNLVCRLLLEKKKKKILYTHASHSVTSDDAEDVRSCMRAQHL